MPGLHEQQRRFANFITATDEAPPGLAMPGLKSGAVGEFTDEQRLQIYRNNYRISLREALAGVYPVVQKLVGEEFFHHAAREYVLQHPSHRGNLHHYGADFATFLQGFPGLEELVYLPDVARLEWAHHQVFHATEDRALRLSALAALDEQAMMEVCFVVSDACRLLVSDYPVVKIWQLNQAVGTQETLSLDEGGVRCVVIRHGCDIEFHVLDEGGFTLLETLAQGKSFARACEAALAVETACDIGGVLQYLVVQKMIVDFGVPPGVVGQQVTDTGERK